MAWFPWQTTRSSIPGRNTPTSSIIISVTKPCKENEALICPNRRDDRWWPDQVSDVRQVPWVCAANTNGLALQSPISTASTKEKPHTQEWSMQNDEIVQISNKIELLGCTISVSTKCVLMLAWRPISAQLVGQPTCAVPHLVTQRDYPRPSWAVYWYLDILLLIFHRV